MTLYQPGSSVKEIFPATYMYLSVNCDTSVSWTLWHKCLLPPATIRLWNFASLKQLWQTHLIEKYFKFHSSICLLYVGSLSLFTLYLGLRREDLYVEEDPGVSEAIRRLPEQEQHLRLYRIKRAIDLSMKHAQLPKEQWTTEAEVDLALVIAWNWVLISSLYCVGYPVSKSIPWTSQSWTKREETVELVVSVPVIITRHSFVFILYTFICQISISIVRIVSHK